MFATAMMQQQQQPPLPVFGRRPAASAAAASALSSPFRPARPSPLSSSPLRAASPPSAASWLSQHDTQSSPPQGVGAGTAAPLMSSSSPPPRNLFRFAARPAKPVPRLSQNRDATRQTRRSLFLNNVRQRADDRAWNRRDCEQELQKLEWWSLERQIQAAREADAGAVLSEQDLEDAADWLVERSQAQQAPPLSPFPQRRRGGGGGGGGGGGSRQHHEQQNYYYDHAEDADMDDGDGHGHDDGEQRMADQLAAEEEAELEALLASMAEAEAARAEATAQGQHQPTQTQTHTAAAASAPAPRPDSPAFSDDDSYDAIFAELVAGHEDTEMGLS